MCQHWPKYQAPSRIQKAVASKEAELKELYGIEKSAMSLAALLEAQTRNAPSSKQRKAHELEVKQRDTEEMKARDRERGDFLYNYKREQQTIKDNLKDEKAALEKEIRLRKEASEKEFAEREKALASRGAIYHVMMPALCDLCVLCGLIKRGLTTEKRNLTTENAKITKRMKTRECGGGARLRAMVHPELEAAPPRKMPPNLFVLRIRGAFEKPGQGDRVIGLVRASPGHSGSLLVDEIFSKASTGLAKDGLRCVAPMGHPSGSQTGRAPR